MTLHSCYITLYLRYYILLNYNTYNILYSVLYYIYMSFPLLSRRSYVTVIVSRNELSNRPSWRERKRGQTRPFFPVGLPFFFCANKSFERARLFVFFVPLRSRYSDRFPIVLFVTSFTLPIFKKKKTAFTRNTKRWWPYFFGWRDFIFLDFLRQ